MKINITEYFKLIRNFIINFKDTEKSEDILNIFKHLNERKKISIFSPIVKNEKRMIYNDYAIISLLDSTLINPFIDDENKIKIISYIIKNLLHNSKYFNTILISFQENIWFNDKTLYKEIFNLDIFSKNELLNIDNNITMKNLFVEFNFLEKIFNKDIKTLKLLFEPHTYFNTYTTLISNFLTFIVESNKEIELSHYINELLLLEEKLLENDLITNLDYSELLFKHKGSNQKSIYKERIEIFNNNLTYKTKELLIKILEIKLEKLDRKTLETEEKIFKASSVLHKNIITNLFCCNKINIFERYEVTKDVSLFINEENIITKSLTNKELNFNEEESRDLHFNRKTLFLLLNNTSFISSELEKEVDFIFLNSNIDFTTDREKFYKIIFRELLHANNYIDFDLINLLQNSSYLNYSNEIMFLFKKDFKDISINQLKTYIIDMKINIEVKSKYRELDLLTFILYLFNNIFLIEELYKYDKDFLEHQKKYFKNILSNLKTKNSEIITKLILDIEYKDFFYLNNNIKFDNTFLTYYSESIKFLIDNVKFEIFQKNKEEFFEDNILLYLPNIFDKLNETSYKNIIDKDFFDYLLIEDDLKLELLENNNMEINDLLQIKMDIINNHYLFKEEVINILSTLNEKNDFKFNF